MRAIRRRSYLRVLGGFLISILLLGACGGSDNEDGSLSAGSNGEGELVDVEMRLDWLYQGPNIGFIVAESKGFYEEVGLNVNVEPGEGSGTTAQLVANKSATFGFSDGYVVAQTTAQGASIKYVAGVYRRNPAGILSIGDTVVSEPSDLVGLRLGLAPGSSQAQQWPAFIRGCGLDEGDVQTVSVDPAGQVQTLLEGRVDGLITYVQGSAATLESQGEQTNVFWFTDCGVTTVSNGIIAHNDTIEENPDLVRDFVEASIKGFLYARENPEEAVDILLEYAPEYPRDVALGEMEFSWETWVPPSAEGQSLGWTAEEDWAAMLEILAEFGGVENAPEPGEVYTNEFVPEGEEFIPPQP